MKIDGNRQDMGRVGAWVWDLVTAPAPHIREAVRAIEDMGYGAVWFPESRGREAIALSAILLAETSTIKVAPGIANIWARDASAAAGAAMALGEAWPERFMLGLGVSHASSVGARGHEYLRPLTRMEEYLNAMESAVFVGPRPDAPVPVVLAALGPKMLRLAADRTTGAHPYFVPVSHTAFAREIIGPDVFLAPEQAVVLDTDADRARATARGHMEHYLLTDNYRRSLLRLGWAEADLESGGSDALVDAVVSWGSADEIAETIAAHHQAGADHVSIQVISQSEGVPLAELEELAGVLL
ncbi:MAG: TIGR03620 family F420-dependent LLM class oxidoreductase [Acidobacteria bacterium]|nr:TIGR03620 family F420-dependent LLM class oxidoreductase [Acidobacteriota bacterium]